MTDPDLRAFAWVYFAAGVLASGAEWTLAPGRADVMLQEFDARFGDKADPPPHVSASDSSDPAHK